MTEQRSTGTCIQGAIYFILQEFACGLNISCFLTWHKFLYIIDCYLVSITVDLLIREFTYILNVGPILYNFTTMLE